MLKKNKSKHVQENSLHAPSGPSLNSIVSGTQLEGDVVSQSDIRIDGIIKGNLNCSSKVIIGPSGVVEGTIECNCALIEGSFEGVINVEELLQISENAKVSGEVRYTKLVVQPGAVLVGDVRLNGAGSSVTDKTNHNGRKQKTAEVKKENISV